ncbi:MAG TPA: prepilin-type N-terminal cleavage/methylation domain-containing protein, partial [Steroidobacteraceae bacterium]|nr:prepilin-type N-terminal cleavage/methylation domain-containing protein [Steroidobacteraceae bacterium]
PPTALPQPRCRGLSLVEMLVAMGIAATLLTLGVPSLSRLRADWTVRGAAAQILAGLQLARRTALQRVGKRVDEAEVTKNSRNSAHILRECGAYLRTT